MPSNVKSGAVSFFYSLRGIISYEAEISQKIPLDFFLVALNSFSYSSCLVHFGILNADDKRGFLTLRFVIMLFY